MVKSAADLASSFHSRFPNAGRGGTVDSLAASAEPGTVDSVEAMAVTNYASVSGPLQFVQAVAHFRVGGTVIKRGDYVQVTAADAKRFEYSGRAILVSDEQAAAAAKKETGK